MYGGSAWSFLIPFFHAQAFQVTVGMTTTSDFVISNANCIMHLWWLFSLWCNQACQNLSSTDVRMVISEE
jgi:hypothetical protein